LDKSGFGYLFALAFLTIEVYEITLDPAAAARNTPLPFLIYGAGFAYWLFWVHRLHKVAAEATNATYPITPAKAVAFHFIPFFNLIWLFKWPSEIARFVNSRVPDAQVSTRWPGVLLFIGLAVARLIDGAVALVIIYSVAAILTRHVRRAAQLPDEADVGEWPPLMLLRRGFRGVVIDASMGAGYGLVLYEAFLYVLEWPADKVLKFLFVVTPLVLLGIWRFIEPITEHVRRAFGLDAGHKVKRTPFVAGATFLILLVTGLLHAILHDFVDEKPLEVFKIIVLAVVVPGGVTAAWILGAQARSSRAARYGALAGLAGGGLTILLTWVLADRRLPLPNPDGSLGLLPGSVDEVEGYAILNGLLWLLIGCSGGIAIDRQWSSRPTRATIAAVGITMVAANVLLSAIGQAPIFTSWQVATFIGWSLGLMLSIRADAVFRPRQPTSTPADASAPSNVQVSGAPVSEVSDGISHSATAR